jgi:hypothetical protein
MSTGRVALGSWSCRSGNTVDAFLGADGGDGQRALELQWDSPPPLSDADQFDYDQTILPAVIRRAQEYLDTGGFPHMPGVTGSSPVSSTN